jgi:hypothetical protein
MHDFRNSNLYIPRQFHTAIVENRQEKHIRTASGFPALPFDIHDIYFSDCMGWKIDF